MKILLVGEAARHQGDLEAHLDERHQISALPAQASSAATFDDQIDADDVVVSLRFSRPAGTVRPFRLLHVPGAGLDAIDLDCLPPSVEVCNVFEHEVPIAEYVFACLLEREIGACRARGGFTAETWSGQYLDRTPHGELYGKTLGLIGYGRVGRAIAQRALAFGLRVLAVDDYVDPSAASNVTLIKASEIATLYGQADYLAVTCPLTDQTRNLVDAGAFRLMRADAVLINVSRAPIVNEQALFDALTSGEIAAAILDVWYNYPAPGSEQVQPSNLPLLDLPNVWGTPHTSAWTHALPLRRYAFIAANINRLVRGEPLLNHVWPR